ncbi:MAG TPA: hypothetical protein VEA39_06135 [Methylophilaceae bacterium]|nr:hypothetical protein [Methylophilaceae bacterium]
MKILSVLVPLSDRGDIIRCDAIEYKGGVWLVPMWLELQGKGLMRPARIIRVDLLGLSPGGGFADYLAPEMTISTALLDGHAPPSPPIEVVESPDVSFPIPNKSLH